jgi:DNA-entry nuclease
MEGYSVEDAGKAVSFCIFAFNVQPGVEINYATGENKLAK